MPSKVWCARAAYLVKEDPDDVLRAMFTYRVAPPKSDGLQVTFVTLTPLPESELDAGRPPEVLLALGHISAVEWHA